MSKSKDNVITRTYSGKFGDQIVLRNRNGLSVLAMIPKKFEREPTPAQLAHQLFFRKATIYAKAVMNDPIKNAKYAVKAVNGKTVYTLAISDFMKPPVVDEIDVTNYKGKIGDKIVVQARDRFEVTQVNLKIIGVDSEVIEEGPCTLDAMNLYWGYTATVQKDVVAGMTITATAMDNPGHAGNKSCIL
jgi:hypothetical protein